MVRTRAGPTKVSAGKAPSKQRAVAAVDIRGSPSRNGKPKESSGNSYHPRETPGWQKPINSFFQAGTSSKSSEEEVQNNEPNTDEGSSSSAPSSHIKDQLL